MLFPSLFASLFPRQVGRGAQHAIISADKRQLQRQRDESENAYNARTAYCIRGNRIRAIDLQARPALRARKRVPGNPRAQWNGGRPGSQMEEQALPGDCRWGDHEKGKRRQMRTDGEDSERGRASDRSSSWCLDSFCRHLFARSLLGEFA